MVGETFGRLTVLSVDRSKRVHMFNCRCSCGNLKSIRKYYVLDGTVKSCGCLKTELNRLPKTHGLSRSPEYMVWNTMKERCHNPNSSRYADYGARGITVCELWQKSFMAFYEAMGPRPSKDHSVERLDNSLDYEPGNCVWASRIEQQNNTRRNRKFSYEGTEYTVAELATKFGINYRTLHYRLTDGNWSVERAVSK